MKFRWNISGIICLSSKNKKSLKLVYPSGMKDSLLSLMYEKILRASCNTSIYFKLPNRIIPRTQKLECDVVYTSLILYRARLICLGEMCEITMLVWICVVADFIYECEWPIAMLNSCVDLNCRRRLQCNKTLQDARAAADAGSWPRSVSQHASSI